MYGSGSLLGLVGWVMEMLELRFSNGGIGLSMSVSLGS